MSDFVGNITLAAVKERGWLEICLLTINQLSNKINTFGEKM